jgi:peptide/nickel transport system ATP-binding protein
VPILDIRHLVYWYRTRKGPVHAVDDVSLQLEPGETIAIVGESGCGKTSMASAVLRLLPKNVDKYEGEVIFDGQDIMSLDDEDFRKNIRWKGISMVLQGAMNALNPTVRVGYQVAEPLIVHYDVHKDEALQQAEEVMSKVGLPSDVMRRFPHELSGGMKQRVVTAMALILKPKLVILDEPTSALDVMTQTNIINLLKALKSTEQLSYIFITHDLGLASELADLVGIMYAGQLVEIGPAEGIFLQPRHPYTGRLLASVPRLRSEVAPEFIAGAPPDLTAPPPGCRFHLRCPVAFEKCGWSAEEVIERMKALQLSAEPAGSALPTLGDMEATDDHVLVLKPKAPATSSELAAAFVALTKDRRETTRFLKAIKSVEAKAKGVEVHLHPGGEPPLEGDGWRDACWLTSEAKTHDVIPA